MTPRRHVFVAVVAAAGLAQDVSAASLAISEMSTMVCLPDGKLVVFGEVDDYWVHDHRYKPDERWVAGDGPKDMGVNLPRLDLDMPVGTIAANDNFACAAARGEPAHSAVKCFGRCILEVCGTEGWRHNNTIDFRGPDVPFVPLESNATVVDIQVGLMHACALLSDGAVVCFGAPGPSGFGETGPTLMTPLPLGGPAKQISTGALSSCAILEASGEVVCWGSTSELGYNYTGKEMPHFRPAGAEPLALGAPAVAVAQGPFSTCVVLEGGAVKCWGDNYDGQLGYGDTMNRFGIPDAAIDLGGPAIDVASNVWSTCIKLADGGLKCWGRNSEGQLGLGVETREVGAKASQVPRMLPEVNFGEGVLKEVAVGMMHTCVRMASKADAAVVRCWGFNTAALGRGEDWHNRTVMNWGSKPEQMGKGLKNVDFYSVPGGNSAAPTLRPIASLALLAVSVFSSF